MKIEKLENPFMGLHVGCGGSSLDDVISKVNEIIDALNGKEKRKCNDCAMFLEGKCTKPH